MKHTDSSKKNVTIGDIAKAPVFPGQRFHDT